MPGWLIILIVFMVGGAILGILGSLFSEDNDLNPAQGCLTGLFGGGLSGLGCLGVIFEAILPIILTIMLFNWLFKGCF